MTPLSARERRAILLGVGALAVAVLNAAVVTPLRHRLAESQLAVSSARDALLRERSLERTRQRLQLDAVKARRSSAVNSMALLSAPNIALANAALARYLRATANEADIGVDTIDPAAVDTIDSAIARVTVEVSGTGDAHGILMFLDALAQSDTTVAARLVELEQQTSEGLQYRSVSFRLQLLTLVRLPGPASMTEGAPPRTRARVATG